jgi:hypothetical protein
MNRRKWASVGRSEPAILRTAIQISDGEVKIAAIILQWNNGIEFSCVPYKLCEGTECAFPQVHFAIGTFCPNHPRYGCDHAGRGGR